MEVCLWYQKKKSKNTELAITIKKNIINIVSAIMTAGVVDILVGIANNVFSEV
jgi:hypothetical protein